ncbi:hypothetical protein X778_13235 [Pseudomonas aeruginosa VRFPA07]|nr:hypothetical protein X778_13235 [Pseudomonas aeruginosa VRFPA07]
MPRLFLLQVRVWKVLMVLDIDMNTQRRRGMNIIIFMFSPSRKLV